MSDIESWIKEKLANGYSKEELSAHMIEKGYEQEYVNSLMNGINIVMKPSPKVEKKPSSGMKTSTMFIIITLILLIGLLAFLWLAESRSGLVSNLLG